MSFRESYAGRRRNTQKSAKQAMPRIQCDFNSAGWSGEDGDECYYTFDEKALERHRPRAGMRVFIFESSRDDLVMGCEAELEPYRHPISDEWRWRLRPLPNTGYLGQLK